MRMLLWLNAWLIVLLLALGDFAVILECLAASGALSPSIAYLKEINFSRSSAQRWKVCLPVRVSMLAIFLCVYCMHSNFVKEEYMCIYFSLLKWGVFFYLFEAHLRSWVQNSRSCAQLARFSLRVYWTSLRSFPAKGLCPLPRWKLGLG